MPNFRHNAESKLVTPSNQGSKTTYNEQPGSPGSQETISVIREICGLNASFSVSAFRNVSDLCYPHKLSAINYQNLKSKTPNSTFMKYLTLCVPTLPSARLE